MSQPAKPQSDVYFAQLEGVKLTGELSRRFTDHLARMRNTGWHDRIRRVWQHYNARDASGNSGGRRGADTSKIGVGGRQGETTLIRPNRLRARLQRMLNMNTGATPSWDCVALNTDAETSRQSGLGDHVIEHYGSAHKLYERLLERDEASFQCGEAFIGAPWDPTRGNVYGYADDPVVDDDGKPEMEEVEDPALPGVMVQKPVTTQRAVYEGDFRFLVLTPYDCATESYSEDRDRPNWCIFRYQVNKWDLAIQFPNQAEDILAMKGWSESRSEFEFVDRALEDEDSIAVYEFYHVKSPSMPQGRMVKFISGETEPLSWGPLKYNGLPVFRTSPGDVLMSDGGYTPMFDLVQLVEAYQAQLSCITSNQAAAGVQTLVGTKGNGATFRKLGPMNYVELNAGGHELKPLEFEITKPEMFQTLEVLESNEDFVTGQNAATRGDSEALKGDSGSKSALVLSTSQQMQNRFQRSRTLADSMLFTHIIDTLKTHATVKRMISISGKSNAAAAEEFVGEELDGISRVVVHPSNPAKDTPEGRAQLFDAYMQMGVIKTPEDVFMVMTTGRLDHVDEEWTAELTLIKQENEMMGDPTSKDPLPVLPTDMHLMHMRKHRSVFSNPKLRTNAAMLEKYKQHQMEHMQALMTLPPAFLEAMGQQSLATPPQELGADEGGASPGDQPPTNPKQAAGNMPKMPKGPTDPATGKKADLGQQPQLQPQT